MSLLGPQHVAAMEATAIASVHPTAKRVEEEQQWYSSKEGYTQTSPHLHWCKVLRLIYAVNDLTMTSPKQ